MSKQTPGGAQFNRKKAIVALCLLFSLLAASCGSSGPAFVATSSNPVSDPVEQTTDTADTTDPVDTSDITDPADTLDITDITDTTDATDSSGVDSDALGTTTTTPIAVASVADDAGSTTSTTASTTTTTVEAAELSIVADPTADADATPDGASTGSAASGPTTATASSAATAPAATSSAPAAAAAEPVARGPVEALTTWVATAKPPVTHLVAYDSPGGNVIPFEFVVPNPHQFGGPQTLMVVEGQPEDAWVKVQLPIRPNGQTGWIESSYYTFGQTQVRAEVDLSARSIVVYDGTTVIAETRAVIGSSATPTPLGTFFIAAKRRNPPEESYIGPWALALSAYSEVYDSFSGGLPVIAIHGTNRPHQVGEARSNGCLRIPNDVVTLLAEFVPLGAPVIISA